MENSAISLVVIEHSGTVPFECYAVASLCWNDFIPRKMSILLYLLLFFFSVLQRLAFQYQVVA